MSQSYEFESNEIPSQNISRLEQELEAGENIVWTGQPVPYFVCAQSILTMIMGIPFTSFSIFWEIKAWEIIPDFWTRLFFMLFGSPFVIIGLSLFGSPLWLYLGLKKTLYAITNKRVIIIKGGVFSTTVRNVYPGDMADIVLKERSDGTGDIRFDFDEERLGRKPWLVLDKGFLNVRNAREVEKLLKNLAAENDRKNETAENPEEKTVEKFDSGFLEKYGSPPRELSLPLRVYLRLCSTAVKDFGWIFAIAGLGFSLIGAGYLGLEDAIPRSWENAGKGKITEVEDAKLSVNDTKVFVYHFQLTETDGNTIDGYSYGAKDRHKPDDTVDIERASKRYRIKGLSLSKARGAISLIFCGIGLLFAGIGLAFPMYSYKAGGKSIRLLRDGEITVGNYTGMTATSMRVNNRSVMKVDFRYAIEEREYTASVQTLDTSRLENQRKVIFYDASSPEKSIVLDGLPEKIDFDEMSQRFYVNLRHCIIPLFCTGVIFAEIFALLFFVVRAL